MPSIDDRITSDITSNPIVLYMKGTALMPMCGFSARAVDLLRRHCQHFTTKNVLEDPELREGIKIFSSWPTIPQLYVNGDFIGGCDIIVEMEEEGTLGPLLLSAASSSPQ